MNRYATSHPEIASRTFMNVVMEPVRCAHCGHHHQGVARKSFLGFKRFTCGSCRKEFDSVLHARYRVAYWLLLAVFAAIMLRNGGRPNLFVILTALPLALDLWRLGTRRTRA